MQLILIILIKNTKKIKAEIQNKKLDSTGSSCTWVCEMDNVSNFLNKEGKDKTEL